MKKSVLTLLGLGAACAACCAIPIALPALAGFGLAGLGFAGLGYSAGTIALGGSLLGLAAMAMMALLYRRRLPKSCDVSGAGCGCSPARH